MSKKKQNRSILSVGEEVRIAVNLALKKFLHTEEIKEFEFPSSFSSDERAYVHDLARQLGLRSKSRSKGPSRYLTVYKREGSSIVQADAVFQLVRPSRQHICTLLNKYPFTNKERENLLPLTERDRSSNTEVRDVNKMMGRLQSGIPQLPPLSANQELLKFRKTLPIWGMREDILHLVNNNQVSFLVGETGCGKTTQVPQFIVEQSQQMGKPCRIICTQPRRLPAVSVAERVSAERDEKVGETVGYQIRLETRIGPKTVLIYCTDGVLLRTLMSGDSALATVTHIIIDEVHERGRLTDFLLIALRDALTKFRSLRLLLMSATADAEIFTKYFNNCPIISVPGKLYEVKEYFLEQILKLTKYMSKKMIQWETEREGKKEQRSNLEKWMKSVRDPSVGEQLHKVEKRTIRAPILGQQIEPLPEKTELEKQLIEEMDSCIYEAWLKGSNDSFNQLLHLFFSENVSVDYQHSETGVTALMVAAGRGCINTAEQLLNLGANINVRACNDWTAIDWARQMEQTDMLELLMAYKNAEIVAPDPLLEIEEPLGEEERELLDIYHHSFNDENIDFDLIMKLLFDIHASNNKGAVLIFLPGYDDIVALWERILSEEKQLSEIMKFNLYILHSSMQTGDQKCVFTPSPPGIRKIILSTNIAETSITIDDVVFVIDSGKVKERSFDAISGSNSLCVTWISQASARQRKGRAGRSQPGICYHLFSSIRYKTMLPYNAPELLRCPLLELCLHTKLLAPPNSPIADFLARAIEPPSFIVTRNAVQLLKTIDALDSWEDLTELGHHLLDLPVDPRYGKMLLYSVILKCLDPVLTIVSCMASRDAFELPSQPSQKRAAALARKKFGAGTYSDHMVLLRAFQAWQNARANGWEHSFCEKNYISSAIMEMIVGTRTQLLGQLRASGFVKPRGGGDIKELNINSENWAVVKAALCAGAYPNLIRVDREQMQLRTQRESRVMFHPSSALRDCPKSPRTSVAASQTATVEALPSDWLFYEDLNRCGHYCHVRCCTLVTPITIVLFTAPMRLPIDCISEVEAYRSEGGMTGESDSEVEEYAVGHNTTLKLDNWTVFRVDSEAAHLAFQLRQKMHNLVLRRLRAPSKPRLQVDEAIVQAVVHVLTTEESNLGLQQPSGIGQRPRPMTNDVIPPGDRLDSGSMKSFGSHNASCSSSPTPSQSSGGGGVEINATGGTSPATADGDTCYFIIKAGSLKTIDASLNHGAWPFTHSTEKRVLMAFKKGKRVILIFSVQGSGHFQGYARLLSSKPDAFGEGTEVPQDLSGQNMGQPLPVEWIKRSNIPFQATRHLLNPLNEDRRVQTSRDGQEVEPKIGQELCDLWDRTPPFVSKSSILNSLKGNSEAPENRPPKNMTGRPIRGYSYTNYGVNYQNYYNPRGQNPK